MPFRNRLLYRQQFLDCQLQAKEGGEMKSSDPMGAKVDRTPNYCIVDDEQEVGLPIIHKQSLKLFACEVFRCQVRVRRPVISSILKQRIPEQPNRRF